MEDAPGSREFSATLRSAIQRSGLTLDTLRGRLAQRGLRVSVATLSYWQRGRSRPERAASLAVVGELEQILDLPADALTALLRPRRSRGRGGAGPAAEARLWSDPRPVPAVLAELDRSGEHRLEWLTVHDIHDTGADRRPTSLSVRKVLRATGDGVDRVIAVHQVDGEEAPEVASVRYCRRGRTRRDSGLLAFELFFERALNRGETAIVEYELRFSGDRATVRSHDRRFRHPVGEYLCVVRFHPDALPARCYLYRRETADAPHGDTTELWVGASGSAHTVSTGVRGGILGVEWEWE